MTPRLWHAAVVALLAVTAASACRTGPPPQPGDPMLDAIRAEGRGENLTYIESQGRRLFVHYCVTCHGDEARGDGENVSNLTRRRRI